MRIRLQRQWLAWLKRRMPVLDEVRLHRRNIFILPSKFGGAFGVLNLLLFVLGVNYQNNLVIILSSFCFSLFMTTMLLCYQNMAGILIRPITRDEFIAGQLINIECHLSCANTKHTKTKHGLTVNYRHEPSSEVSSLLHQKKILVILTQRDRGVNRLHVLLLRVFIL